nr:hypothetical protein HK105_006445 [Polyrhizophydium stewartii]
MPGKSVIKAAEDFAAALEDAGPAFASKYIGKLLSAFDLNRRETLIFLQLHYPAAGNSLFEKTISDGDADWIRLLPLSVLLPNTLCPAASDDLAANEVLCASIEERFRDDQIDIPRLSRVTATLLLWTQASVRHVPSLKRARNRIAFALRLVRIALERAETLAAGDAASCSLRRHVLGHPLLLELFLQRKIAGLQQILGFARAADGVAMHEFISKLWARLDPAAIEGSAESISILLASLQALAPFIRASDLSERIHAFLSHNARSTTQERVLLALITHYVAASRSHSTGAVRMGRDLFKQLLLAVTSGDHDAAALFDDLVQEIGTLAGSAHGSSVSSSVITDRTLRLADGTTVEFALPLDVWSVLTPDALSTLLADTNSGPLWRFMLTNAAASVPHAVHLLGLARRPEKRSTGAILAIEQRAEAVCAVLKAWTILAAVNPWRLEWIERLPKTHLKLAQEAADAVADHYFAAIEACLEGNATPRHLAVDAHTLAAVLLAAGDKHASGWLMQLVPRLLKTKIIDANTSVQTLSRIWPALFSVAESAGIARLGDLVVFVLRAIYLQIKRDMPGRETAAAVESLVAQFSHPSDGSVAVVRFESMALVKSAITVILKHRLADPCALSFLRHLVDVVYSQHSDERLPSPKDLFDMITSHSQFDDILMAQADSPLPMAGDSPRSLIPQFHPAKSALLRLLHRIMLIEPTSCCMPDMVPRLAGSYFGTVAAADRATLAVLALFETHASISVAAHMASWAPSRPAPGEHAPAGNSASKLLHQPTDILSSIDPQWMAGSVRWFELNLDIDAIDKQAKGDIDSNAVSREPSALRASASEPAYDPTFILPLVAGALVHRPCTIDPHSLIESNALGMAIMALASTCESTRRVGHLIMSRAHHLIARSEIKERNQVMLLLDGLRNGIAPPAKAEPVPARIPTVIAAFGAQALSILTHPESDLYPLVNQFLLQRPIIDSEDVPMFYSMLYSTSELCGRERTWILRLLSAGLSLDVDYKPYKRRHVLEILMGAFHSSMVDATARKRLIEVMLRAVAIPAVLATLIGSSGMLGFLESCCSQVDFSEAPDTALGAAALVCATLRGFGAVAESWSDRGRINRSLWAMQLAQLARTLAARALHIQHGAPHRRAALTLRILTAVDLAQQVGAKIGLGSALIGAEDITTLLEATQQTYKAASVPGSPLADTYVPDEEDVDDGEDDDKNDNESESAEEGGEPQGRAQRAGSAAPGARTTIPGVRSSFQGDCGLAGDLDGVFIINRAALGHIGRNAIAAFFAIVGGAHVPWEVEAGDLGQTASLLRDIVSFARSAGIADATEPLLAWTVRHLLAAQGDRLVEWLVRESPSDLRDVLQIALDALASPGRDSKSGFRRWHLALAAALLVVRRWTDTDPSKPGKAGLAGRSCWYEADLHASVHPQQWATSTTGAPGCSTAPCADWLDTPSRLVLRLRVAESMRLDRCRRRHTRS